MPLPDPLTAARQRAAAQEAHADPQPYTKGRVMNHAMTVADLIAALQQQDPGALVLMCDEQWGEEDHFDSHNLDRTFFQTVRGVEPGYTCGWAPESLEYDLSWDTVPFNTPGGRVKSNMEST